MHIAFPSLYELYGAHTVFIPVKHGTKVPALPAWQKITFQDTQTTAYQDKLTRGNIGILQGAPSNGLCSIDCDSDDAAATMLSLNPQLAETLTTKGVRGCNFWVRIVRDVPHIHKISGIGEFRSTGGFTVIYGRHPDGPLYSMVKKANPISMAFTDIVWPSGSRRDDVLNTIPAPQSNSFDKLTTDNSKTDKLNTDKLNNCNTVNLNTCNLYPPKEGNQIPNAEDIANKFALDSLIEKNFHEWLNDSANTDIADLYQTHVDRFYTAAPNERNAFLTRAGVKLFYTVHVEIARRLLNAFFVINRPLFKATAEDHAAEVDAVLQNAGKTFVAGLTEAEKSIFDKMGKLDPTAFRIMRNLAQTSEQKPHFFLSVKEAATRFGCMSNAADKLLKRFQRNGLIVCVKVGDVYGQSTGRPMASEYRWSLPLPDLKAEKVA